MILIADSGSTKTDWCIEENGSIVLRAATQGINPFHQEWDTIATIVNDELLPQLGEAEIDHVYFYGSGCREEQVPAMQRLLGRVFTQAGRIEACGDLLAAARAVCGKSEGIACILGTGANSCLYDGQRVVKNTSPLGYILGDEGSGAVMGKLFVNAAFKGKLPEALRNEFLEESHLTMNEIIRRVYCEPMANRFLASFAPFIRHHLSNPLLRKLVVDNFRELFRRNVEQYGRHDLKVGAIGSVAFYFSAELTEAAAAEGFTMDKIMRSPMEGLVRFHANSK